MIVKIYPSEIEGEVVSPPSKSYTHRALIAAAMGSGGKIYSPLRSEDTRATVDSLKAFGADLVEEGEATEVSGVDGQIKTPEDVVNVLNSGTTLRLMMGLGSNCKGVVLTGDVSLRKRPSGPLLESLRDLGAEAYSIRGGGLPPIVVKGYLKGGTTEIPGDISSQFISSLLMSCPLAEGETTIKIYGELKSRPYLEITLDCLDRARIDVEHSSDFRSFRVEGGQRYALSDMTVPGDVSQAANLMVAAAVGGHIKIENLFPSKQGDFKILDILKDMGASVKWDKANGIVEVSSSELEGVEIDASGTPDLVPILAVLGCFAGGETTIINAKHLRFKETDRLKTVSTNLRKMGADLVERHDGLLIRHSRLKAATLDGFGDHRIVMASAIASLFTKGVSTLHGADCISVSYPGFFEDIKKLGSRIEVIS